MKDEEVKGGGGGGGRAEKKTSISSFNSNKKYSELQNLKLTYSSFLSPTKVI